MNSLTIIEFYEISNEIGIDELERCTPETSDFWFVHHGSPQNEVGRDFWEGEREVTLSYEFYLGATPVTQKQFELVMPDCPRQVPHHLRVEDTPVDSVFWQWATEFCAKLTRIDRDAGILSKNWKYRLRLQFSLQLALSLPP